MNGTDLISLSDAVAIVVDAARQQAALARRSGRLDGVAELQAQACSVVEDHFREGGEP